MRIIQLPVQPGYQKAVSHAYSTSGYSTSIYSVWRMSAGGQVFKADRFPYWLSRLSTLFL